jgi:ankyrin repeat protein
VVTIATDEPLAVAAVQAIHSGEVDTLKRLLAEHPELATARLGSETSGEDAGMTRTLLHVATDWPGHFLNGPGTVAALVAAGADVNAHFTGPHAETPLHWAASSDDVAVLEALIAAGADLEAEGSVIDGGTPLADAVAFGQWNAARRLIEHRARANLWQAAGLGLIEHVKRHLDADPPPGPEEITGALWCACHGGQRETAEYLLERGAELNWIGYDDLTPLDAAVRSDAHELARWLRSRGAKSARRLVGRMT